jgi:sulfate permease, SulP family
MLKTLKGDIFGGLTAGVVALPLALAFGIQSGLGAISGIYGAIAVGLFAALFGGTNTQVSGPTGPMTVISALVISTAIAKFGGVEQALPAILVTFFLGGCFLILFGVSRIGQLVRYIPYPVISGFMTGIGIIIIVLQVFPSLGLASPRRVIDVFINIFGNLDNTNIYSLGLMVSTVFLIYTLRKIIKQIPSELLALLILTGVATYFKFPVPIIGHIPSGLPQLKLSTFANFGWSQLDLVIVPALTLGALGALDSLLTSVVADNMTRTKHNSNRELIGQGIGNMVAASIGGLPGAGATMRTVVNIKAGGKTRLSGIIHSLFLLLVLVEIGTYASLIPLSVLSGILFTVGVSIIDMRGLKSLPFIPRADAIVLVMVILLTVFVNLLHAVAAGMVLASVLFMKKSSELIEEKSKVAPLVDFMKDVTWPDEKTLPPEFKKSVYIKHLDGPLFFGFVSQFESMVEKIPEVHHVIIRMKLVPYIDQSGLYALEDAISYLRQMNIEVIISGLKKQPQYMLERINIIPDLVPEECVFTKFDDAVHWVADQISKE